MHNKDLRADFRLRRPMLRWYLINTVQNEISSSHTKIWLSEESTFLFSMKKSL